MSEQYAIYRGMLVVRNNPQEKYRICTNEEVTAYMQTKIKRLNERIEKLELDNDVLRASLGMLRDSVF